MINVSVARDDGQFPIRINFDGSHKDQKFTKLAARELKNKLIVALEELEVAEAMASTTIYTMEKS